MDAFLVGVVLALLPGLITGWLLGAVAGWLLRRDDYCRHPAPVLAERPTPVLSERVTAPVVVNLHMPTLAVPVQPQVIDAHFVAELPQR